MLPSDEQIILRNAWDLEPLYDTASEEILCNMAHADRFISTLIN